MLKIESFNEKQISAGYFTLKDMQILVMDCNRMSDNLGLTIGWSVRGHHVAGSIRHKQKTIYRVKFTTISFPLNLCNMYEAIRLKLEELMQHQTAALAKAQKEEADRESERRIAAMPSWASKIKAQQGKL
jgi:hypothetical protein